jgi:PilZ domain
MEEVITETEVDVDALPEVIATRSPDIEFDRREGRRVWCEAGLFPTPRCFRIEQGVSLWPRPLPSCEVNAEPLDVSARGIRLRTRAKNVKSPLLCEGDRIRLEFEAGKWNDAEIILECVVRFVGNDPGDETAALVGLEMINPLLNPQRRKMWSNWKQMIGKTEREKLRRLRQI